ncbi:MAG: hypothetical protein QOK43_1849 [Acidimicrobiaceae bacterium]|nr:hypothetical protein [Acidimicrobiaceae bacterium]
MLIPFAFQLIVLPRAELVTLFASQAAADHLRKHPGDPEAAKARAVRVVEAFGGEDVVRGVQVEVSVVDGRSVVVVTGHARPVVSGFTVPMRSASAGPLEVFRPDDDRPTP